jgi:hypothetical protein
MTRLDHLEVASSTRMQTSVVLIRIVASLASMLLGTAPAAPSARKLVLTGTVTAIFQLRVSPPSRRNWGVTVQVERVTAGKYTEPTFTFTLHSPARAGLEVGARYTIEATWNGHAYEVDEPRPIRREP